MMDRYEQEMYDFLTQRENFEAMQKINEQFSKVKEQLLRSFWNEVVKKLDIKAKKETDNWLVYNPLHKERGDAKILVYKKEWIKNENHPVIGVGWEKLFYNPYFGVWINEQYTSIDATSLKGTLASIAQEINFKTDQKWWPLWLHGKYNFSNNSDISYILPDRLETMAEEYANIVIELLPRVEGAIDECIRI